MPDVTNIVPRSRRPGPVTVRLTGGARLHAPGERLGERQRLQRLDAQLIEARASTPDRKFHSAPASSSPAAIASAFSASGKPIEQRAAHGAMLDVGAFVHAEEAQSLLVVDAVAVDQAFDLGAGNARELALIGVERAQARRIGTARQLAEGIDQRLRFGIELLRAHRRLSLSPRPQANISHRRRMVLLARLDALFLGKILGEHAAAVAVRAGAVHRAHRAREGFDMMEILPGVGAQRVERQAAFGPRLVEGMA